MPVRRAERILRVFSDFAREAADALALPRGNRVTTSEKTRRLESGHAGGRSLRQREGPSVMQRILRAVTPCWRRFWRWRERGRRRTGFQLELRDGWAIQSSAKVTGRRRGRVAPPASRRPAGTARPCRRRSSRRSSPTARIPTRTTAPTSASSRGCSYKVGTNFSNVAMPADSPFAVPWWYRTEFTLPAEAAGRTLWLRFDGVNFRFDAWLNGKKIADAAKTGGAFRDPRARRHAAPRSRARTRSPCSSRRRRRATSRSRSSTGTRCRPTR